RAHEIVEAGGREHEDTMNRVSADVGHLNPGVGGGEDRGAGMHLLHPITQAHPRMPVLQKDNLVCTRVAVPINLSTRPPVLGDENQMRRAAVVPIDLEYEWARLGTPAQVAFDWPPGALLAVVLLEHQWGRCARAVWFLRRGRGRAPGDTPQHCTNSHSRQRR